MNLVSRGLYRLREVALAHWVAALCLAVLAVGVQAVQPDHRPKQPADAHWVGSWAVAPLDFRELAANPAVAHKPAPGGDQFRGQTLRQQLAPTLGGDRIRIRFSNRFGKAPLRIAAASVARSTGADAISPSTLRVLRFGGRTSLTLAPGAEAWSDGVDLKIEAGQTMAVSAFFDRATPYGTVHLLSVDTSWVAPGNAVAAAKLQGATTLPLNHIVTGLDVLTTKSVRTVLAFGDSITAGGGESGDGAYPDMLATRLRNSPQAAHEVSVLNAGIGGNRLLVDGIGPHGLSRFARDALGQSGVTHAIVLLGTNDIGRSVFLGAPGNPDTVHDLPTADRITDGLQQLVKQARAKGVKILLGTVPPFRNTPYWNENNEAMRTAVNRWIRSRTDVDGVIDFDAALRDPADPQALNPQFDNGDHLHPNKAGHAAMAAAIDLKELQE
ncbi:lysophospholipase L1-like esterase [Variovorax boronicumulans]|uniref:GDSL-type esterase/lipase family protein n=1 Tax=Variovorax TaxID=34072 RepID=UPI002780BF6C|nr:MULTISPECIES: GDSL-type esterase/lipase family protein [Variovorax]MDQ0037193.1 lysophospholipase L1-like esterase [Variovorax boronicumulans]MDQ0612333.1 lysophospholipase L1-like esterase [Variovorax sp. W1I1]